MSVFLLVVFGWRNVIATPSLRQNEKTGSKPVFNAVRSNQVKINPDF
jgi:hypothetical protein